MHRFFQGARKSNAKHVSYAILIWALVSGLVVGIVLGGLKACWFWIDE